MSIKELTIGVVLCAALFIALIYAPVAQAAPGCGDYWHFKAAYGLSYNNVQTKDDNKEWTVYDSSTFEIGYNWNVWNPNTYLTLQGAHDSQLFTNIPFNSRTEITSEQVTIGIEYRIY